MTLRKDWGGMHSPPKTGKVFEMVLRRHAAFTPAYEEPMIGKQAACQILSVVFSIFENFYYPDIISGRHTHALIFRAEVSGVPLEGVDYVRTDENELVTEFNVMMRPLKAITALTKAIGAKIQNG